MFVDESLIDSIIDSSFA